MAHHLDPIDGDVPEPQARTHTDFWGIAVRRKSLVTLGIVVGLVLGALYYAMRTPAYKSDAQVLVIKKRPDASPIMGADYGRMAYFEDFLSTHQVIIKSPLIIGRAVEKGHLQGLASFTGVTDPIRAITRSLAVSRELKETTESSNILNLSFRGRVADECKTVLDAIIDSYKDFLDETYKNVSDETVQLITQARNLLQKDLAQKETDYNTFREAAPLLWKGKEGVNPHQERLTSIEAKRGSLIIRQAEIQGRLTAIEKGLKEGRGRAALLTILMDLPASPSTDTVKRTSPVTLAEQLLPLLHEEQVLLADYGPEHPRVQSVRKRIELTRRHFAQPMSAWNETVPGPSEIRNPKSEIRNPKSEIRNPKSETISDLGPGLDPLEIYILSLKQELQDVQLSEQLLAAEYQAAYDEARTLANIEMKDERFRNDIERTRQLYVSIVKRLEEVGLARDFGGYDARTLAPSTAGVRVEPNALPVFTAAVLLGIMAGLVLAYVAERTDKSFRTPEEVRRRLGLPIVGHIPLIDPVEEVVQDGRPEYAADPLLWSYYRPQSAEAESYRAVRTALYFSMQGKEHSVIQITSPDMGDGKTTLVGNLGVSLAQMGKNVLVIDADLRRPRLHKVFGISAQAGLTSAIQGESDAPSVIQEGPVKGLWILPCGVIPPNPAELLISPRFKELLDRVRSNYDFVLIDTPPLLAVTDPCVVAPCVDGVLLNIRVSKYARPNALRAKEILTTLGATVLGVVVNGVDPNAGSSGYSYGYKSYHYRKGYGYTNGYHSDNGEEHGYPNAATQAAPAQIPNPKSEIRNPKRVRSSKRLRSNLLRRLLGMP